MGKHVIIAVASAAAILGATMAAPVAHADTLDDRYSSMLSAQGIAVTPELLRAGHDACAYYGGVAMIGEITNIMGLGLSSAQASSVALAGIRAYCPEKIAGTPLQ